MVLIPHENDILLGRGTAVNTHPGNLRFRSIVSRQKSIYAEATTKQIKRQIAISIVREIQSLSPPGRFLIDSNGGKFGRQWMSVETEKAIEKVLHRLREKDKESNGAEKQNKKHSPNKKIQQQRSKSSESSDVGSPSPALEVASHDNAVRSLQYTNNSLECRHHANAQQSRRGDNAGALSSVDRTLESKNAFQGNANLQLQPNNTISIWQADRHHKIGDLVATSPSAKQLRKSGEVAIRDSNHFTSEQFGQQQITNPAANNVGLSLPVVQLPESEHFLQDNSFHRHLNNNQYPIHQATNQHTTKNALGINVGHSIPIVQLKASENNILQGNNLYHQMNNNNMIAATSSLCQPYGNDMFQSNNLPADLNNTHDTNQHILAQLRLKNTPQSVPPAEPPSIGSASMLEPDPQHYQNKNHHPNNQLWYQNIKTEKTGNLLHPRNVNCLSLEKALDLSGPSILDDTKELQHSMKMSQEDAKPASLPRKDDEPGGDLSALFSQYLGYEAEEDTSQPYQELSLRKWIERSKPNTSDVHRGTPEDSHSAISGYIKCAIPIALKLMECLIEAEGSEHANNPNRIPLASITAANVLVQVQAEEAMSKYNSSMYAPLAGLSNSQKFDQDDFCEKKNSSEPKSRRMDANGIENVVNVRIVSYVGDNPLIGNKTSRLHASGIILYELFSRGNYFLEVAKPGLLGGTGIVDSAAVTPANKKTQRPFDKDGNCKSGSIAQLNFLGIPQSLVIFLKNLLDCDCGDDGYESFTDVLLDLHLMTKDPERFLDNIQVGKIPSFSISNELYGREQDALRVKNAYKKCCSRECGGVIIMGEAGVGKSKLAMTAEELTKIANGYFLRGKFDQHNAQPLLVVGAVFNDLCDAVAEGIRNHDEEQSLSKALENAIGSQASILSNILPSLSKLMPVFKSCGSSSHSVDFATCVQFLFGTLLQTLSTHFTKTISIFLDDLQWADPASLLMISSLLHSSISNKHVFFIFCCRDDLLQDQQDAPLNNWLRAVSALSLDQIKLQNLNVDSVNRVVSDTLRLSPRLTRPLSAVLYNKTFGNPLFVGQMLESLKENGHLSFSLKGHYRRWTWDLEKICDLHICDNVLSLLIREMKNLPENLQLGLEVAACIGASVDKSILEILSTHLGINLCAILCEITRKRYMDKIGTSQFRFVHDKVQQAAYEMMSEHQQREKHMEFGLAICSHALANGESGEMLFTAISQINRGGPELISDAHQKSIIAALNLKVGRRCTELSDFASALGFFKIGISFLNAGHWDHQYKLVIDLFDAAADAACELNDSVAVEYFSESLLKNAKYIEDKFNVMYIILKSLRKAMALHESKKYALHVLELLGEEPLRLIGDPQLDSDIQKMHNIIIGLTDDYILNLKQTQEKKLVTLLKIYHELVFSLQGTEPMCTVEVCTRMVQLSLNAGTTEMSPIAFAYFGIAITSITSIGSPSQGYRLGSLALRLAKKLNAVGHLSSIIALVQQHIAWVSEPLQSIAESHILGHNAGKQSGDIFSSSMNYSFFLVTSFFCGKSLDIVRKNSWDFIQELLRVRQKWFVSGSALIYLQSVALIEGLEFNVTESMHKIPDEDEIVATAARTKQQGLVLNVRLHKLIRAFLFRQYDEMSKVGEILNPILEDKTPLRINYCVGVYFEGLVSFCMARQTKNERWALKGEAALVFVRRWAELSAWNFENKTLLLEAEKMSLLGNFEGGGSTNFDQASELYTQAIRSSRQHKFLHEEAISCELAGLFYHDRNANKKAFEYLTQAVRCYRQWGAEAVAKRVESFIQHFEPTSSQPFLLEDSKSYASSSNDNASKRCLDFD